MVETIGQNGQYTAKERENTVLVEKKYTVQDIQAMCPNDTCVGTSLLSPQFPNFLKESQRSQSLWVLEDCTKKKAH